LFPDAFMGNTAKTHLAADPRIEHVTFNLKLVKRDIAEFWETFKKYDYDCEGKIHLQEFMEKCVKEKRNFLADGIVELVDVDDPDWLNFGEYVQAVSTFCCFEEMEVLQFCFFLFDREKHGYIMQDALVFYIDALHNHQQLSANIRHGLNNVNFHEDGRFDFMEFVKLNKDYPQMIYPAFRLQQKMMMYTMGEAWWKNRKALLAADAENMKEMTDSQKRHDLKRRAKDRQSKIRNNMGAIDYYTQYYFRPDQWKSVDDNFPKFTMEDLNREEEEAAKAGPAAAMK